MKKNKGKELALFIFTAGILPFLATIVRVLQKDLDEPATLQDLLVLFGVAAVGWVVLAVKIFFFNFTTLG